MKYFILTGFHSKCLFHPFNSIVSFSFILKSIFPLNLVLHCFQPHCEGFHKHGTIFRYKFRLRIMNIFIFTHKLNIKSRIVSIAVFLNRGLSSKDIDNKISVCKQLTFFIGITYTIYIIRNVIDRRLLFVSSS